MNRNLLLYLILFCMLNACQLFKQAAAPVRDPDVENLLSQGMIALKNDRYLEASDAFEAALKKDFNRSTTVATYLAGLSAYYQGYDEIAQRRFNTIIRDYPRSQYVEDAHYHMALLNVRHSSPAVRLKGYQKLMEISQSGSFGSSLQKAAAEYLNKLMFEDASITDIESFYKRASEEEKQKLIEARVYRKIEAGENEEGISLYLEFLQNGGDSSTFLNSWLPMKTAGNSRQFFEPDIIKLAVFMPLFLESGFRYMDQVPDKSERAVHFYEGFQLAVESFRQESSKKVYLKVFDTRRDSLYTRIFTESLDSIGPNLVIGSFYNQQSRIISEWAEEREVPQIIPTSPSANLIENKSYSFLAHPSAETHGARLAEYARDSLMLERVAVFTDESNGTRQLMSGFCQSFIGAGGTIDTLSFHQNYEDFGKEQIPELIDDIKSVLLDSLSPIGVYVPVSGNEEAASLIINLLKKEGVENIPIMGSPHFRTRYNTLGRDIKEDYKLIFTSSYLPGQDNQAYRKFDQLYRKRYRLPPTEDAVQGYDLANYLLNLMEAYDPNLMSLDLYLRLSSKFESIHLNYHFSSTQSNQEVNIGRFIPDGIQKIK